MFHKLISFGAMLTLAVVIAGCGDGGTAQSTNDDLSSENLSLDPSWSGKAYGLLTFLPLQQLHLHQFYLDRKVDR